MLCGDREKYFIIVNVICRFQFIFTELSVEVMWPGTGVNISYNSVHSHIIFNGDFSYHLIDAKIKIKQISKYKKIVYIEIKVWTCFLRPNKFIILFLLNNFPFSLLGVCVVVNIQHPEIAILIKSRTICAIAVYNTLACVQIYLICFHQSIFLT